MNHKEKLLEDLKALGIQAGDTVLVHTSIKGLNVPDIKANDIIEALLAAVGEQGTLLVPALSYASVTPNCPVYDYKQTPTCIGTLPEVFRTQYASHRSIHPTHSVCAVGRMAHALTSAHKLDNTPVGERSPFRLLTKVNGKILMLGCGLKPNTFMHGVEEMAFASYCLRKQPVNYTVTDSTGTYHKDYYPHNFDRFVQRYDRLKNILSEAELKKGQVLNGEAYLIEAVAAIDKGVKAIMANDLYFVDSI
ncbi:AAC(3) family N-acetyltransferase [Paludicola sp. MB14-C6]|uniref:AAC(3) family N-acetyltransferase n=1 Tax=Paludihabitans sp. MB14-C6 TaxID=3070656 RepID=UPI0027DD992C|nr:AAC(3) family N-acetyltransferase [Paludicola sp. MB14-C6]WMJ22249.1 AAC(3) family N-acetyltransferase [Paludicola sp. MB14-C6]